jgi:dihydrofolate synthase/folylpolyglutamate synthase
MPIAAAITSIGFDHQAQLGDTLAAIAREKAGVIKPGVPVVCGRVPSEAARVIEEVASGRGARLVRVEDAVIVTQGRNGAIDVATRHRRLDGVRLALRGRHQQENAAVAVALLDELAGAGITVPDTAVRDGLSGAVWPGRLEPFQAGGTDILLDAAHNPAGAAALAAYLAEIGWTGVTLLFGAMQDKDVERMLEPLAPLCAAIVCTTPPTPRALAAEDLAAIARKVMAGRGVVEAVADPAAALAHARHGAARVVAAGSIFLIGPLRDILR